MIVNGKYLGLSSVVKTFKYYFAPLIDSFSYHFEKKTCTRLKQARRSFAIRGCHSIFWHILTNNYNKNKTKGNVSKGTHLFAIIEDLIYQYLLSCIRVGQKSSCVKVKGSVWKPQWPATT